MFVPPPDREARESILRLHLRNRPVAPDLPFSTTAASTEGFSGADLAHVCSTAAEYALEASLKAGGVVRIEERHLRQALKEVRSSTEAWLDQARNYVTFANGSGQYDDLAAYLRSRSRDRR